MSAGARPQSLIEGPDLSQSHRTESHVCAEHAFDLDYLVAVVGDWQIEIHRQRTDFLIRVFLRQDSALHAHELATRIEERFDGVEIASRHGQIVVEENQDFTGCLRDRAILDAAFSGARFVQMLERGESGRELHRRRRAVFGDNDLAGSRPESRRETGDQPHQRRWPCMRRDYDRGFQFLCEVRTTLELPALASTLRNRITIFSSISRLELVMKRSSSRFIWACSGSSTPRTYSIHEKPAINGYRSGAKILERSLRLLRPSLSIRSPTPHAIQCKSFRPITCQLRPSSTR